MLTYFLGLKLTCFNESNSSSRTFSQQLRNVFWKAKAPPKAKLCCWKNFHDIILIKANLAKK